MKLFKYQQDILDETKDRERVAYYLPCGVGKTFIGSEKLMSFPTDYKLIVCQRSKVDDWCEHMLLNYGIRCNRMPYTDSELKPTVNITTYGSLKTRHAIKLFKGEIGLLFDESSKLQNDSSVTWKAVGAWKRMRYVVLLSGTPVTGDNFQRLWSQAYLLGSPLSKKEFYTKFMNYILANRTGTVMAHYEFFGCKDIVALRTYMMALGAVFKKEEDLVELPGIIDIVHSVSLWKRYSEFASKNVLRIGIDTIVGDTPLNKLTGRRLIAAYADDRTRAAAEIIESSDRRWVVFYNFKHEMETLVTTLKGSSLNVPRAFSFVNGETKDLTNYDRVENSITFVQYASGAYGLNLQKANQILFLSPTLSPELYTQARARIRRLGQEETCYYHHLLMEGTIEPGIKSNVERGIEYNLKVFEDVIAGEMM